MLLPNTCQRAAGGCASGCRTLAAVARAASFAVGIAVYFNVQFVPDGVYAALQVTAVIHIAAVTEQPALACFLAINLASASAVYIAFRLAIGLACEAGRRIATALARSLAFARTGSVHIRIASAFALALACGSA